MRFFVYVILFFALLNGINAQKGQPNDPMRMAADPDLAPFYHGVASGDPTSSSVILWTRLSDTTGTVDVQWRIALDTAFNDIVNSGTTWTGSSKDFTVKVDVEDLEPYTYYFYDFEINGKHSLTGRTKTAPEGDNEHFRAAVVSCSNYEAGYFHAYDAIAERNDIDLVIHLGDYIYEYGVGEFPLSISGIRLHEPENEILNLPDYRMRHSQYKLDPDLRRLHQHYPMIAVWDDHETANNAWRDGAENHDEGEGLWADRKEAGTKAYHEWMPIRSPDEENLFKIYRSFSYGKLVDIFMLDTRLYDRDEQSLAGASDTSRTLLGPEQMEWLINGLSSSEASYKILGNQVMMAPLLLLGGPLNNDQWDGYSHEQSVLRDFLEAQTDNFVVITGDIHTSWANDIPGSNYEAESGEGSVAVEYVVTSVTSPGLDDINLSPNFIMGISPHTKYVNLDRRGFVILDINADRVQGDWYYVSDIAEEEYAANFATGWYSNHGENKLNNSTGVATQASEAMIYTRPPLAPFVPEVSSGMEAQNFALLGLYPNPAAQEAGFQFFLQNASAVSIELHDLIGRLIKEKNLQSLPAGLNYQAMDLQNLTRGNYLISITIDGKRTTRQLQIK